MQHRLPRLSSWLDYVIELGANGLLLAPVFASASHGYDTLDHYRIDPRLGDDADFDALVVDVSCPGHPDLPGRGVQPPRRESPDRAAGSGRRPGNG